MVYWTVLAPVHGPLFRGMLMAVARATGATVLAGPTTPPKEGSQCRI